VVHKEHTTHAPDGSPAPSAAKAEWRRWARAIRSAWAAGPHRARDQLALRDHLGAWAPWRAAGTVLLYLPFGDEVDPQAPLGERRAFTTRTDARAARLTVHDVASAVERHPLGFLQPPLGAPEVGLDEIDLALVPGLAFDVRGARLGYGRALYDGLLPQLPAHAPRVGVTIDALVVPALPSEPHDVPVTHLLTPTGLRAVAD
jgi:5-formyltetrahydrofolate cyclo-ligase